MKNKMLLLGIGHKKEMKNIRGLKWSNWEMFINLVECWAVKNLTFVLENLINLGLDHF
jgi:hypothetical protein